MCEQGHAPLAITSAHAALPFHAPVPLYTGPITLEADATRLDGDGRLLLAFIPHPHLKFEMSVQTSTVDGPLLEGTLTLTHLGCSAPASVLCDTLSSHGEHTTEGILQGGVVTGPKTLAHAVRFHLLNFAPFLGSHIHNGRPIGKGRCVWAGRAQLQFGPWVVVLDQLPKAFELWKQAELACGYTLTHMGELRRNDGDPFSYDDAAQAFEFLYWALSFANGARCDCVLRTGFSDTGQPLWEEWSVGQVDPAAPRSRWIPDRPLRGAFDFLPSFYALWQNPISHQWLPLAIGLYTAANCEARRELALITGQVALELLTSVLLPSDKGYAYERIRALLKHVSIPKPIPQTLQDLHRTFPPPDSVDGPEAVTRVRNRFAHPTEENRCKLKSLVGNATYEAAQLTLWYVEMVLLHHFGYKGNHYNRTRNPQWAGANEPVPWV